MCWIAAMSFNHMLELEVVETIPICHGMTKREEDSHDKKFPSTSFNSCRWDYLYFAIEQTGLTGYA